MPRGRAKLSFGLTKAGKSTMSLVREMQNRTQKVMQQLTYDAANEVKETIESKLPSSSEYKNYRKNLEVVQVQGGGIAGSHALVLKDNPTTRVGAKSTNSVVFFEPSSKRSPAVDVLVKYGPWTVDTLPYKPPEEEARIVYRKVSKNEWRYVRDRVRDTQRLWSPALKRQGIDLEEIKSIDATSDIGFTALRLEFGIGGESSRPHWRPAISGFTRHKLKKLSKKDSVYNKVLSDLNDNSWLSWPEATLRQIPYSKTKQFKDFSKRLGLKVD